MTQRGLMWEKKKNCVKEKFNVKRVFTYWRKKEQCIIQVNYKELLEFKKT